MTRTRAHAVVVLFLFGLVTVGAAAARPVGGGQRAPSFLAGQLLVAAAEMRDPRFFQTVVYLVRHDRTGAMGLVVNRPLGAVPLARLLEHLGLDGEGVSGTLRVHYGGPVEETHGFVLHTGDYAAEGTVVVADGIAVTDEPAILGAIAAGHGPRRSLFAMGYAGWAPGQLEAEIEGGHWATVSADEALLFDEEYATKWERAMARVIMHL